MTNWSGFSNTLHELGLRDIIWAERFTLAQELSNFIHIYIEEL